MTVLQSRKFLMMAIVEILHKYTDDNHRLSQKEISDILENEYGMAVDRKSLYRYLKELVEADGRIEYSEKLRMMPVMETVEVDGKKIKQPVIDTETGQEVLEENYILSDFYMIKDFADAELRLLIDSMLFSRHISYNQRQRIIKKLEGLSSVYFKAKTKHIASMPDEKIHNDLFYAIEILDEAISKGRKVSFKYTEYGTDKKMHIKKREDGNEREYIINPYQMVAREGKYYLICNYDKYDDISNYRLDRIRDIRILDEPIKPFKKLKWANGISLDLATYMKEHPYMYSSPNTRVRFRIVKAMISDIIDVFGKDVSFMDETDTHVTVSVYTNEMSVERFAKSFAPDVVVLEPKELADKVCKDIERTLELYKKGM